MAMDIEMREHHQGMSRLPALCSISAIPRDFAD